MRPRWSLRRPLPDRSGRDARRLRRVGHTRTCRSTRVIASVLISISRITGSLCARRRTHTLVRPAALRRRARTTLGLNPVANIIDPPSGHAKKQFDRRGEGPGRDMAPQRRSGDRHQGQDLRHAQEAGQRSVRGHDVSGIDGIERRELRHLEIFSARSPLAAVTPLAYETTSGSSLGALLAPASHVSRKVAQVSNACRRSAK